MPGNDPCLLIVPCRVASQLKNLCCQILHDGSHVDWSSRTNPLGVIALPIGYNVIVVLQQERGQSPEQPVDATHRELESGATGPRLSLALHLASLSAARHGVNNLEWGITFAQQNAV